MNGNVVVLTGGTGGARFVRGVARCVPPEKLTVVVNTGDDITTHGMHVSPDVDIIMYTLAGIVDDRGWGFDGDTFHCLEQLRHYGRDTWFQLGDRDIATHLMRTMLLEQGYTLTQSTGLIAASLGIKPLILPMTDQNVETHIQLGDGSLIHFQEYLIQRGAPEDVQSVIFQNIGTALPGPAVLTAIAEADLVLLAPSSPVVSLGTILSLNGVFDAIGESSATCAAVSPLMGEGPISGPSGPLMKAFGIEVSNLGLCDAYGPVLDLLVIHTADADDASKIEARGIKALCTDTLMPDMEGSIRVARTVLESLDYEIADVESVEPKSFEPADATPGSHRTRREADSAAVAEAWSRRERELLDRIEQLESQAADAGDAGERLAALELAHTEALNRMREDTLAAADEDIEVLRGQMSGLEETIQSLEEELAHARAQQPAEDAASGAEGDGSSERIRQLEQEVQDLSAALNDATQTALEYTGVESEELTETITQLEDLLRQARHEAEEAQEGSQIAWDEYDELVETLEAFQEEVQERLSVIQDEQEQMRVGFERQKETVELELAKTQADLEEERARAQAARDEMESAHGEASKDTSTAHAAAVAALTSEWESKLSEARKELEARVAALEGQRREVEAEAEQRLRESEDTFSDERKTLEDEVASLQEQLKEAKDLRRVTREKLKEDHEKAKSIIERLQARRIKLEGRVKRKKRQLAEAEARVETAERERADTAAAQARLERELGEAHVDLEAARTALDEREGQLAALQRQLTQLQRREDSPIPRQAASPKKTEPAHEPVDEQTPEPDEPSAAVSLSDVSWKPEPEDDQEESMAARAKKRGKRPFTAPETNP